MACIYDSYSYVWLFLRPNRFNNLFCPFFGIRIFVPSKRGHTNLFAYLLFQFFGVQIQGKPLKWPPPQKKTKKTWYKIPS